MIDKRTRLDKVEIDIETGILQIRIALELIDDGNVLDQKWHRTAIERGGNVSDQFELVGIHLKEMKWPLVSKQEIEIVKKISISVWQ